MSSKHISSSKSVEVIGYFGRLEIDQRNLHRQIVMYFRSKSQISRLLYHVSLEL